MEIRTPRLRLVPGTEAMLRAELVSREALAAALDADVSAEWPPDLFDEAAVRYVLEWLAQPSADAAWGFHYVLEAAAAGGASRALAIGAGGYKGAPDASGTVEIGYGIVPGRRRRGYAREAVDGWLAHAFADRRVTRVIAHTLPALAPSIAVLRSAGFAFDGAGVDPHEPDAVRYAITREDYERPGVARAPVQVVR